MKTDLTEYGPISLISHISEVDTQALDFAEAILKNDGYIVNDRILPLYDCTHEQLKKLLDTFNEAVKGGEAPQQWDVLSPDGISIQPFSFYSSPFEAITDYMKWKQQFEAQGYYSSNSGRILLQDLFSHCTVKQIS